MPNPLAIGAAIAGGSLLLSRLLRPDEPLPEPRRVDLLGKDSQDAFWVLGRAAVDLRASRFTDRSGYELPDAVKYFTGALLRDDRYTYSDLHLAIPVSNGPISDVEALWFGDEKYPLRRAPGGVRSDGGIHYLSTRLQPPYATAKMAIFTVIGHYSADGTQGKDFRELAGIGSTKPFLSGISWIHLVLRQPSNWREPDSAVKWAGQPRVRALVRGLQVPSALSSAQTPSVRWTDDATDLRHWYMTEILGVPRDRFDVASLKASAAITRPRITLLDLNASWWGMRETPSPPSLSPAFWVSTEPAPTAAQPILWAAWSDPRAEGDDGATLTDADREWEVVPYKVRQDGGAVVSVSTIPTGAGQVRYRLTASTYRERRYAINGVLRATDDSAAIMDEMDFAWQGQAVEKGGLIHFRPGADEKEIFAWKPSDSVVTEDAISEPDPARLANAVSMALSQGRMNDWRRFVAAPRKDTEAIAADGRERGVQLRDARFVTDPVAAQRLLRTFLVLARRRRERRWVFRPTGQDAINWAGAKPLDAFLLAPDDIRCVITSIAVSPTGEMTVEAVEAPLGAYDDLVDLPDLPGTDSVAQLAAVPAKLAADAVDVTLQDGGTTPTLQVQWDEAPYEADVRYRVIDVGSVTNLLPGSRTPALPPLPFGLGSLFRLAPPGWDLVGLLDGLFANYTPWRTATVDAARNSFTLNAANWFYRYEFQVRHRDARGRVSDWATVTKRPVPTLSESPQGATAMITDRVVLTTSSPANRNIVGIEVAAAHDRLTEDNFLDSAESFPVVAGDPVALQLHVDHTLDTQYVQCRFVARNGAKSSIVTAFLQNPGRIKVNLFDVQLDAPPANDTERRALADKWPVGTVFWTEWDPQQGGG